MRHASWITRAVLLTGLVLMGCKNDQTTTTASNADNGSSSYREPALTVPSGTSIEVALATDLTSETANVGDSWSGTLQNSTVVDGRSVFPAGSVASGRVSAVNAAQKGERAMLDLQLTNITVGSHSYRVHGTTEAVIAGSTRARNLGAIGAATVAGAVIGHAVGKSRKGTIIGGLLGGGAAAGVVSKTSGYQVHLKTGTPLTFVTNETLAVRQ